MEKLQNWETESGGRLLLVSALRAAARRVSGAEAILGLFNAAAARERICMVLDIMNLFSELI